MPILQPNQSIGKYEVKRLIKENHYCETYRVEDDNETNSTMKVVKAYTPISDAVWIGFEVLIDSTPVLADFVPRGIKMLRAGQEHFYEALQAG